ncbi:MAG: hypothetical protein Q7U86_01630 [Draconibacterium sp.]|nr:hypothetical protein [Draconibacterium sp.]
MKTTDYLIILFTFLFSFNAFSQNELKINNITRNQEVSGNLVVKLDTTNIKDYRFASYYMDDKFISNIYDAPFTIQFDTRDFENGKHTFYVKALRVNGIVEIDKVEININNKKPAVNFIVKDVRRFASIDQVPIDGSYIDAPHSILKKNDNEFYIQHSKGLLKHTRREKHGITARSSGTLENPFASLEWSKYVTELWDKNGHPNQGLWIMSMYKISNNELLAFVHTESCYDLSRPCEEGEKLFTVGLGYSKDNGESWTFLGDILRPYKYDRPVKTPNVGGVGYVIAGDEFQIFFQEFNDEGKRQAGTARANMKQVIDAARKGKSFEWKKLKNGQFTVPGLTALSDDMLSNHEFDVNMHCKATYAPSIDKYLLLAWSTYDGNPVLYLFASSDAINWELAETITDHNTKSRIMYPFFGSLYSDDVHEVGNEFNIYWGRNHRELWGASVIIEINRK